MGQSDSEDHPKIEIVVHGGVEPPKEPPIPLNQEIHNFRTLFPPTICALCLEGVANIEEHLHRDHSVEELESYQVPESDDPKKWNPRVNDKEAAAHPGGREGALIEKTILISEREGYRQDITALIRAGHQPGFLVAQVAYHMLIIRRFRLRFEREARKTGGDLTTYDAKSLGIIDDLTERISRLLLELEKVRKSRLEESAENPLAIVEAELASAESWVRGHIGEFVDMCPKCQQPIIPPGLPHWAFAPIETPAGTEWMAWSPELFAMVQAELMPLWQMCYALRVSPEGLQFTASRRGEAFREDINWPEEEALLREALMADDQMSLPEALRQRAPR